MLLNKYNVKVYKFEEFRSSQEVVQLDKVLYHLKRNKKRYMQVVIMLAYIMFFNPEISLAGDKIVEMGYSVVRKIQLYAGIVAMVMAVIELAGELIKGGRNHFQIIFKYGVGYLALLLVPTVFEMIRNLF